MKMHDCRQTIRLVVCCISCWSVINPVHPLLVGLICYLTMSCPNDGQTLMPKLEESAILQPRNYIIAFHLSRTETIFTIVVIEASLQVLLVYHTSFADYSLLLVNGM